MLFRSAVRLFSLSVSSPPLASQHNWMHAALPFAGISFSLLHASFSHTCTHACAFSLDSFIDTHACSTTMIGRVAVVTGGSKGIGREVTEQLYLGGANVYIVVRKDDTTHEHICICPVLCHSPVSVFVCVCVCGRVAWVCVGVSWALSFFCVYD